MCYAYSQWADLLGSDKLRPGERLNKEQYIRSRGGKYVLVMQWDCNLVIYPNGHSNKVWASDSTGKGKHCYAEMQTDGNLVVYDKPRNPVWWSNSTGKARGGTFVMQDDGNAVIYSNNAAEWDTGSASNAADQCAACNDGSCQCGWGTPDSLCASNSGNNPDAGCRVDHSKGRGLRR